MHFTIYVISLGDSKIDRNKKSNRIFICMPNVSNDVSFGIHGGAYMKSLISYLPAWLGFLKTIWRLNRRGRAESLQIKNGMIKVK